MAYSGDKGPGIISKRRNERGLRRMIVPLACMVVAVIGIALMLPAISMTRGDLVCDMQEHAHSKACYEHVLACGLEEGEGADPETGEGGHVHGEACYEQQLVCDIPEHEHSDACYESVEQDEGQEANQDAEIEASVNGTLTETPDQSQSDRDDDVGESESASASANVVASPEDADGLHPAVSFEQDVLDGAGDVALTVKVEAPEDALPEGTIMKAELVDDDEVIDAAKEAAADEADVPIKQAEALAVDITFQDAEGNAVDPAADVRVLMIAPAIAEQNQLAVVHVDDDANATVVEGEEVDKKRETIAFDAASFSVYALVYTVDFHYNAGGKSFEFSIPGGGFVSLAHLVEALGIAESNDGDASAVESQSENDAANADSATGNTTGLSAGEGEGAYEESIDLNSVPVSDVTWEFVTHVASVEFSNPQLVWVGKAEAETTVGQLKDGNNLEVQHSAELTEDQIAEIDAQPIAAGDWALISLQPFSSEETLTIVMQNGDRYVIQVTDASYSTTKVTDLDGKTVALVNLSNNNALESTTHRGTGIGHLNAIAISYNASTNTVTTVNEYEVLTRWTFEKVDGYNDRYYISSPNGYLNINNANLAVTPTRQALQIQQKSDGTIRIKHPDNNYAVNNDNNSTASGYNAYSSTWDANPGEWFTAFEIGAGSGLIALNPMNENGVLGYINHTSTSYKNMKIDGRTIDSNNLQYSRMYIPVNYNDNGTATITLPSNDQLGSFNVSSADPNTHSITQDPSKYQWVLHGWVNIATGEYYDTRNGPVTATVNQDSLNVFYADWWAANYDYSYENTIDTADTSGFADIKVWDYNELFNLTSSTPWSVDHDANQFIPRTTLQSEEWYITQVNGHQGDYFQFVDNTDSANCWQYGTLGNQQGRNGGNQWSNYIWDGSLGILGTWGQEPSTGVLESLFPNAVTAGSGVNYLGQGNYLFTYNPQTKTYSYDSDHNGAVYSQGDGRFYVSNSPRHHWRGGGGERDTVGFLPLNDASSALAYNNGTINYWFGMSMDLDFWLPDTPGSSAKANLVANQHMRFDFNGDDDVWVLIDGKLALDIGGIHEAVGGYIDFTTGEIRNAKGNTYNLRDMGIGAGAHTLSFYYLEQGGNASNCKISFNIVPRWDDEPVQRGTASVTKTWSADTPEEAKQALSFYLTCEGAPVEGTTVGYANGTEAGGEWTYVWTGLDPSKEYEVVEAADPRFEATYDIDTIEIKDVWAAASYHKDEAFGSETIVLGNGVSGSGNGRLLSGNGSSATANIEREFIRSTVGNDVKWTVEGYDPTHQHFYLKNSSGQYLSIKSGSVSLVNSTSSASWFYMSPSGDLNDAHSDYRLRVGSGGGISVDAIVNSADATDTNSSDRIHVYTWHDFYERTANYSYENDYKTKDIVVRKKWSDSPAVNHDNDTITIALYQVALNSENEVVAEVEYPLVSPNTNTITGSGTNTITGLPVAGVYEGEFVTYEYHVVESSGKAGYISSSVEDAENPDSWVITNIAPDSKDETTSLDVTKLWRDKDGNDAAQNHEGDVLTFTLKQKAVECEYVPVTMRWVNNGGRLALEEDFYIEKGQDFAFTVSKQGTLIPHRVRVTTDRGSQDQHQWNVRESGQHSFTVQNISKAITVTAMLDFPNDEWGDGASWILQRWGHSVPAADYLKTNVADVVSASKDNEVKSTHDVLYELKKDWIEDGPFTESAANWVATLDELPLYKKISDGVYYTYYYTISEISVNGEQVHPSGTTTFGSTEDFNVSIDQDNMTITNTEKEKTHVTAVKAWLNADGSTVAPSGASVTFELYADEAATGNKVVLNGKEDVADNPTDSQELMTAAGNSGNAHEAPAWTAAWSNLQKYAYKEDGTVDHEIAYTVKETEDSVPEGYEVDYGTGGDSQPKTEATDGGTITNRQLSTYLDVFKVDADGMATPLEGAGFELRRIDPSGPHYLDTTPTLPVTTGVDNETGTDGKATFSGLTSGYYEVKESKTPAGYVLTGDGVFYIRVEHGVVALVEKGTDGQWRPSEGSDELVFTPASGTSLASVKVGNNAGSALPHTGGSGTVPLYLFGGLLMACAAASLLVRRRVTR